jgi:pyruvate dehydrogenase E2 component (dihydrolipoamide acetyltransferase)
MRPDNSRQEISENRIENQPPALKLTRIQKLIGKRMLQSKLNKPCFYLESKADVTELMAMRSSLRKSSGVKITTNAFYIRVLALAAKKYPLMTSSFDGENITIADSVNVGFAVNAPQGLVVPVIKDADKKLLAEIALLEEQLIEKARDNKLTLEEMEAETIALSNLGAYGIDSFFGIVPPPTGAILAVGNVIRQVVPRDGRPAVRKMVSLTLAVDHRITDGVYAAQFLSYITDKLQNPQTMI